MKQLIIAQTLTLLTSCAVVNNVVGETLYGDDYWVSVRNRTDDSITVHYYPKGKSGKRKLLTTLEPSGISMRSVDTSYDVYTFEFSHMSANKHVDCSKGATLRAFDNVVLVLKDSEDE